MAFLACGRRHHWHAGIPELLQIPPLLSRNKFVLVPRRPADAATPPRYEYSNLCCARSSSSVVVSKQIRGFHSEESAAAAGMQTVRPSFELIGESERECGRRGRRRLPSCRP